MATRATTIIIPVALIVDMLGFLDPGETAIVEYLTSNKYKITYCVSHCFDEFSVEDILDQIEFVDGFPC